MSYYNDNRYVYQATQFSEPLRMPQQGNSLPTQAIYPQQTAYLSSSHLPFSNVSYNPYVHAQPYYNLRYEFRGYFPPSACCGHSFYYDYGYYPAHIPPVNEPYYLVGEDYRVIEGCYAARINATMDYAINRGENGGFPNFEEGRNEQGELVYGTVILSDRIEYRHALKPEFGTPDRREVDQMIYAAHKYAKSKGYETGFPTFHVGPHDYGVFLFTKDQVELIPHSGRRTNARDFFIAVNRAVDRQKYAAAFPTYDQQNNIAFIKHGYATMRNVLAKELNLPRYYESFGCTVGPVMVEPADDDEDNQGCPFGCQRINNYFKLGCAGPLQLCQDACYCPSTSEFEAGTYKKIGPVKSCGVCIDISPDPF